MAASGSHPLISRSGMDRGAKEDKMLGVDEPVIGTSSGTSGMREESMDLEHHGRVESVDPSALEIKIKRDLDSKVVTVAANAIARGDVEVGTRVAFTMSLEGSELLSLRKHDGEKPTSMGGTDGGDGTKEADQATRSA